MPTPIGWLLGVAERLELSGQLGVEAARAVGGGDRNGPCHERIPLVVQRRDVGPGAGQRQGARLETARGPGRRRGGGLDEQVAFASPRLEPVLAGPTSGTEAKLVSVLDEQPARSFDGGRGRDLQASLLGGRGWRKGQAVALLSTLQEPEAAPMPHPCQAETVPAVAFQTASPSTPTPRPPVFIQSIPLARPPAPVSSAATAQPGLPSG